MEKKEFWHEMLTTYVALMKYTNGITVPNMVGAYYLYDESIDLLSSQCVIRVLNDIIASPKGYGVLTQKCVGIRNYVLSMMECKDINLPNIHGRLFANMYDSNLVTHFSDVKDIGEYLYSLYQEEITSKRFSVTRGVWNTFSALESGYIDDIIKSL